MKAGGAAGLQDRPRGAAFRVYPWWSYTLQPLKLQRHVLAQVEVLHEKVNGQGSQRSWQFSRRAVQLQAGGGQAFGHEVVMPSQLTDPRWPAEQFWSVPVQLVVLLLPLQLIVPPVPQFAETVQRAFPPRAGRFAAGVGATGVAREATKA